MTAAINDLRTKVTAKIIESLEAGVMPWRKGWTNEAPSVSAGLPRNAVSNRVYSGGNRLMLMMEGMEKGYTDPRWLTYKQAQGLGGTVNKGEKATAVEYWDELPFYKRHDVAFMYNGARVKLAESPAKGAQTVAISGARTVATKDIIVETTSGTKYSWKQAEKFLSLMFEKTSYAFNVAQCTDLKIEPLAIQKDRSPTEKIEAVELIAQGMRGDGLSIKHGGDRAYYSPARDLVQMPHPDQFESPEAYAGTMLHELGHATGGENRLNRKLENSFGSVDYAKEELVAELASAFAAAETGIAYDDKNNAAYIDSWLKAMKTDKHAVFTAAREASQAVDYLIEKADLKVDLEMERVEAVVVNVPKKATKTIAKEPEPELEPEMEI